MRIIAGELGGRRFNSPGTSRTHPMSDKMRGALFSILGDINDLSIMDAFGGSGALAYEAASRGAREVLVLDIDKTAQRTIAENIKLLEISNIVSLVKASANAWLQTDRDSKFDIMLCDPPYIALQLDLLSHLAERVVQGGILVLSFPSNLDPPLVQNMEVIKQQAYGDAQLIFYRA
jgi:16S rRNA (guanine966-N2)-methyltransferase